MNENIKRFTKEDWYGLAGAERFNKESSEPFIYRKNLNEGLPGIALVELTIVADRTGLTVMLACDEDDEVEGVMTWKKEMELNAIRGYGELEKLVNYIEENNINFGPDLSYMLDHGFCKDDVFYGFKYLGEF